MLGDWLAAAFLCAVFLFVLRLVSVAVLWFALPAVGSALLLPAVGYAFVLPAVGYVFLGSFHHRSRSLCSSGCPRTRVALLRSSPLFTTGSLAVVPFLGLSPLGLLAVLLLQSHFVVSSASIHGKVVYNNVFCCF